jgi:hypothetical protein
MRAVWAKQCDPGAYRAIVLIEDTRLNRRAIGHAGPELRRSFPVTARALLSALGAGTDPGGDAIVLMRRPYSPAVARRATNFTRTAAPSPRVAADATADT